LGQVVITAHAKSVLNLEDVKKCLARHARGDWGEICDEDRKENERSLAQRLRLLSIYRDRSDVKFWIITEEDRSLTTILLPEDY